MIFLPKNLRFRSWAHFKSEMLRRVKDWDIAEVITTILF